MDQKLCKYNLGAGQIIFLYLIYENEYISSNLLAEFCDMDKSTITKSVQKLIEEDFISYEIDEKDKRIKKLYTTNKTNNIINELFDYRNEIFENLTQNIDMLELENVISNITKNSKLLEKKNNYVNKLKIGGFQKLTLLDYPKKSACTLFLSGCNFKCPFCHNKDLVFIPENFECFEVSEIFNYLEKRANILDGVCISGGEPLLQEGIVDFIKDIKKLGYDIKLDTNGMYFDKLKYLIDENLIDYVAIDIKNCLEDYNNTIGLNANFNLEDIRKSVDYVMQSKIDYEFRTTVVEEFHNEKSFEKIGEWIRGAKEYNLQFFEDGNNVIREGLHAPSLENMTKYQKILSKYVPNTKIRGI